MRFLLGLVAAFLFALPAFAQPISVEALSANPSLMGPELSPNGHFIAAIAHTDDGDTIELISADNPNGPRRRIDLSPSHLTDLNWAGDLRLLLTVVGEDVVSGYRVKFTRLAILDLVTREVVVADRGARGTEAGTVLHVDPSGDWAIVQSQDAFGEPPNVKRIDLATGEARILESKRPDIWRWVVDASGTVRAGLGVEDNRFRIFYRDRADQGLRKLTGEFDQSDDLLVDDIYFGWPGADAAIITNRGGDNFAAFEYDFASGKIGDPIFSAPGFDIDTVISDRRDFSIIGFGYEDDRPRVHWTDPALATLQRRIDKAMPDRTNRLVSFSGDRQRVIVHSSGPTDSGTFYLLDRDTSQMGPVFQPYEMVDPALLSMTEPVRYQARDGLTIPAYLTLPKGKENQAGLPLIIMPHGGPYSRDSWGYDPFVQLLASRGYAVLQPQFRGSTGRGRAFVEAGYGEWGGKMIDDMEDGMDWLARSGKIDPGRVCIVGMSYGGYAAMWSALRSPDRYRCAVSWAGVSNLKKASTFTKRYFNARRYYNDWRNSIAGEAKADSASISPINHATKLRIPLFIAHGEKDDIVEFEQSRDMVRALERANLPVTYQFYEKAEHDFVHVETEADFMRRLTVFLAAHNPA